MTWFHAVWLAGVALCLAAWPIAYGWKRQRGELQDPMSNENFGWHAWWVFLSIAWPAAVALTVAVIVVAVPATLAWTGLTRLGAAASRHPAADRRARIRAELKRVDAELAELEQGGDFNDFDRRLAERMKARIET